MKILSLLFALCLSASGQSIITATLTFTNTAGTTTGQTLSINGYLRTFTNTIEQANVQIIVGTNKAAACSNLFLAYAQFPQANTTMRMSATNVITFQSYPNDPLALTIGGNWGTVSYSTNTITQATVVRVPMAIAGNLERTNVETGLVDYLNDSSVTNYIIPNTNKFKLFIVPDLVGLTNFILTISLNGTNFTVATSNGLVAYVNMQTNILYAGWLSNLQSAAYQPLEAFQPASVLLSNLVALGITNFNNYLDGSGNIVLTNQSGYERLRANLHGAMTLNFGNDTYNGPIIGNDSRDLYITDDTSYQRIGVLSTYGGAAGDTFIRNANGSHYSLVVKGTSEAVDSWAPVSGSVGTWPATLIGTTTNFIVDSGSSGTGVTPLNAVVIPANSMAHDGDHVTRTVGIDIPSVLTGANVQVQFGPDTVFSTGTFSSASGSVMSIVCEVTRDSSSTARYNIYAVASGITGGKLVSVGEASSLDYASDISFYVQLTAGTGGTSNNLIIKTDSTRFHPSPAWAGLP